MKQNSRYSSEKDSKECNRQHSQHLVMFILNPNDNSHFGGLLLSIPVMWQFVLGTTANSSQLSPTILFMEKKSCNCQEIVFTSQFSNAYQLTTSDHFCRWKRNAQQNEDIKTIDKVTIHRET
jgi:hypothetical protein